MILLTRHKDFYDYLQGVYGRDTKKVFDRTDEVLAKDIVYFDPNSYNRRNKWMKEVHNTYAIHIADKKYYVEQVEEGKWEFHMFHKYNTDHRGVPLNMLSSGIEEDDKKNWQMFIKSARNITRGLVVSITGVYKDENLGNGVPILEGFGFTSIITPLEMYAEIDMWIGTLQSESEKSEELSDKEKLLANGFHNPTSFRHRK